VTYILRTAKQIVFIDTEPGQSIMPDYTALIRSLEQPPCRE